MIMYDDFFGVQPFHIVLVSFLSKKKCETKMKTNNFTDKHPIGWVAVIRNFCGFLRCHWPGKRETNGIGWLSI